jgi:hypothetical protein
MNTAPIGAPTVRVCERIPFPSSAGSTRRRLLPGGELRLLLNFCRRQLGLSSRLSLEVIDSADQLAFDTVCMTVARA